MPNKLFCHGILCYTFTDGNGDVFAKIGSVYYKMVWNKGLPDWIEIRIVPPDVKEGLTV